MAFQSNAFQNNAFQMGSGPTPTPPSGGGGRSYDDASFSKRNHIRKALEKAIREALDPRPIAQEKTAPVKLWTKPARARVFPNYWKEQQIASLMDVSLGDIAKAVAQLVLQQKLQYEQAVRDAEDLEVVRLVTQMLMDDQL